MASDNPTEPTAMQQLESTLAEIIEPNIFVAAGDGNLDQVKTFIAGGVPGGVNAQDEYGYTPLHAACSYGASVVAQWLLSQGANPGIRDSDGDTPLMYCEDPVCADMLLAAGGDLLAQNTAGHVAYYFSVWDARESMVAWFTAQYAARSIPLPPVPPNPDQEEEEEEDEEGGRGVGGEAIMEEEGGGMEEEEGGMGGERDGGQGTTTSANQL